MSESLISLISPERCYGCGACAQKCPLHCISMIPDGEGFLRPEIDGARCVKCGACLAACPAHPGSFHIPVRRRSSYYAGRLTSPELLLKSSSGGTFRALSELTLGRGGAVAGVKFNAAFDAELTLCESREERDGCCVSKYVQAANPAAYIDTEKQLKANRSVMFSGTPCQVAGLYSFLGRDYEKLLTVDFVCHGVPSPAVFAAYRAALEQRYGAKITGFNFRDKSAGYSPMRMRVEFGNGAVYTAACDRDPYFQMFLGGLLIRRCCLNCPFAKPRQRESDITVADAWTASKLDAAWLDNRGVSAVITHSVKGDEAVRHLGKCRGYELHECELADIDQRYLHQAALRHPDREAFFRSFRSEGVTASFRRFAGKRPFLRRLASRMRKVWSRAVDWFSTRFRRKKQVEIFMFVDALGWEIVKEFSFLKRELPYRYGVRMQFGYSSSAVPTILSGRYPEEHGHLSFYYYDPKHSPFKLFRHLPQSDNPKALWNRGRVRHWISKLFRFFAGYTGYFQLYQMPFSKLPDFNYCEKKDIFAARGLYPVRNLRDVLEESGLDYHISNWRRGDAANLAAAERRLRRGKTDFYFLYNGELDGLLHAHVGEPEPIRKKLEFYAAHIRRMMDILRRNRQSFSFTVISDHGMTPLAGTIDLKSAVAATGLEFGRDYAACYDSTLFRVWFFTPGAREKIMAAVNSSTFPGHYLSRAEKKFNGVDFADAKYGEELFLTAPGIQIVPSDMGSKPLHGMHGFDPDDRHSSAAILSSSPVTPPDEVANFFDLMVERIAAMSKKELRR